MDYDKLDQDQQAIAKLVLEAAKELKINPNLLLAQAFQESGFRHIPNKETDAFGVMQIRPGTAALNDLGDTRDLRTNIYGGAKLMRQYLDKYKSPEAALLAYHQGPRVAQKYIDSDGDTTVIGPKGKDYIVKIGDYGGFNQVSESNESDETEADKIKREDEEKKRNAPPKPVVDDSDAMTGAVAGAAANSILPIFTNPQISPKIDTGRAQEASLAAQDKLELARRNLDAAAPQGTADLESNFRQSQGQLEQLKNEQKLAEARLRGLPKAPPAMEMPEPRPPLNEPSRTKAGASGAVNYVNAMSDDVPEVLANQALNMRKDNPRGGQAIIDANTRAIQKQADLGMGDYDLARTAGGVQLALPPTTVAERQADIDKQAKASQAELEQRTEQARLQQQQQTQQLEQQRLAHEAEIQRIRQQRTQTGQQFNTLTGQVKGVAPLQRAMTSAQTEAELAQRRLGRAQQQPNAAGRMLEGVGAAKMGALPRAMVGAGAGYLGVMSYQEAVARYKAGDTSEAVLKALEAGAAGAAMLPPAGKALTKARGLGMVGGLGLGAYELGRRLLKERPPEP